MREVAVGGGGAIASGRNPSPAVVVPPAGHAPSVGPRGDAAAALGDCGARGGAIVARRRAPAGGSMGRASGARASEKRLAHLKGFFLPSISL